MNRFISSDKVARCGFGTQQQHRTLESFLPPANGSLLFHHRTAQRRNFAFAPLWSQNVVAGHERGGVDGGGAGGAESADSKSGGQVCETANRQVDATVRRAQVRGLAILDVRGSLVLS